MFFLMRQEASSRSRAAIDASARPDPNVAILLREPFRGFISELLRRLHRAGYTDLRVAHLAVFQHIDPAGSRITDLAAKAQVAKPSMSYLVEHLEQAGYVTRVPDPGDGRARLIQLTPRGWKQIEDALEIIVGMESELAAGLGPRRMAALRDLLADLGSITAYWRGPRDVE